MGFRATLNFRKFKVALFWLVESSTINPKLYSVGVPIKFPWKRRNFAERTINKKTHDLKSGNNEPSKSTSWKVLETVLSHLKLYWEFTKVWQSRKIQVYVPPLWLCFLNLSRWTGLKFLIWRHNRIFPGNRASRVTGFIYEEGLNDWLI